jgi:SAM-dependent methyltransferase
MTKEPQGDPVRLASDQVIMAEKMAKALFIPAGARVLDLGFGHSGLHGAIAAGRRRAKVTAIHFKEPIVENARARAEVEKVEGVEFIQGDVSDGLPFPDKSFDFVMSTLGINFIADQEKAASELARVLRPGGRFALTAYTRGSLPGQIYELGHKYVEVEGRRHPHEWIHGPRASELLGSQFYGLAVTFDTYDICFESAQTCWETTARWNVNVVKMMANVPPADAAALKAAQLEIMNAANRATDGTFLVSVEYGILTGVRRGA